MTYWFRLWLPLLSLFMLSYGLFFVEKGRLYAFRVWLITVLMMCMVAMLWYSNWQMPSPDHFVPRPTYITRTEFSIRPWGAQ